MNSMCEYEYVYVPVWVCVYLSICIYVYTHSCIFMCMCGNSFLSYEICGIFKTIVNGMLSNYNIIF